MNKKITCIIAAHNEEKRIADVLKVVSGYSLLDEVIVVNDGSKDNTAKVVKRFKNLKLISHKKNQGKTSALLTGIKRAKGDYIVLLDADLVGLKRKNIRDLISPVLTGKADVAISNRGKTKISNNLLDLFVLLSGERAFKKSLMDISNFENIPRYGFESIFNLIAIKNHLRIKFVPMPKVDNTAKAEKIGLIKGLLNEVRMFSQVIKAVGILGCIKQMLFLRRLSID